MSSEWENMNVVFYINNSLIENGANFLLEELLKYSLYPTVELQKGGGAGA